MVGAWVCRLDSAMLRGRSGGCGDSVDMICPILDIGKNKTKG